MEEKVLRIKIGNETRPVVERYDINKKNELFFAEQYHSVFSAIESYLENLGKFEIAANSALESKNIWIENDNNIFTFSGDRGSGKTSCMISTAIALVEKLYKFYKPNGKHDYNFRMISPKQESPLNISDPSFFDESHNIIQLIIAQMFKAFDNKRTEGIKCGDDEKDAQRSKLLDQFRIVHKSLVQQTKKFNAEMPEDGIEMFSCYASSINLREEISELVKRFLSYMYGEEDAILVLPIDDIDLNSTQAVEMMELIRKYLISENILILMAVKLDQLTMLKCQQNIKDNEDLLKQGKIHLDDIDTMTERYISKLLPLSQRVYMPVPDVWHSSRLRIEGIDSDEIDDSELEKVRVRVLSLIFEKTRYLFFNSDTHTCYLVPRNLRELRQIIRLLFEMEENDILHNQTIFKEYLFETWAENHLYTEDRFRINKLFNLDDAVRFNALALELIREKFPTIRSTRTENTINPADKQLNQITQNYDPELYELYHILNRANKVYNISLGDVMGVIGILEQQETDEKNLKFLFLLKALYSIRLYDYYKELDETKRHEPQNDTNNEIMLTSTFKSDISRMNYHRLVGGRFINYRLYDVLSPEGGEKSRTTRIINPKGLFMELKSAGNIYKDIVVEKNDKNKKGLEKNLCEETTQKIDVIPLIEFFMLCTSRQCRTKNKRNDDVDYYDPTYRKTSDVVHNKPFNSNTENLLFDLGAFFYNITCIDECYKRFGNEGKALLYFAKKDNKENPVTLYGKLHNLKTNGKSWLYGVAIRNMDVLWNLVHKVNKIEGTSNNRDVLRGFFNAIAKNEICTYKILKETRTNKKDNIQYSYCSIIGEMLSSLNDEAALCFNSIYSDKSLEKVQVEDKVIDIRLISKNGKTKSAKPDTIFKRISNNYDFVKLEPYKAIFEQEKSTYENKRMVKLTDITELVNKLNEQYTQIKGNLINDNNN